MTTDTTRPSGERDWTTAEGLAELERRAAGWIKYVDPEDRINESLIAEGAVQLIVALRKRDQQIAQLQEKITLLRAELAECCEQIVQLNTVNLVYDETQDTFDLELATRNETIHDLRNQLQVTMALIGGCNACSKLYAEHCMRDGP